jgi:hypothetical protein
MRSSNFLSPQITIAAPYLVKETENVLFIRKAKRNKPDCPMLTRKGHHKESGIQELQNDMTAPCAQNVAGPISRNSFL